MTEETYEKTLTGLPLETATALAASRAHTLHCLLDAIGSAPVPAAALLPYVHELSALLDGINEKV